MRPSKRLETAALSLAVALAAGAGRGEADAGKKGEPVALRANIEHAAWGQLLARYVDEKGLVNYAAWKASSSDRAALVRYLGALAAPPNPPARGEDLAASLINAYNASTIAWVLENYPTESIRSLEHSFDGERHVIGGRKVSLDEIEHGTLRPLQGFRVHATVVCAARSCPPLAREAYRADKVETQLDESMRRWLAREDLNRFLPAANKVEISMIFHWYLEDFQKAKEGLRGVLAAYAPERFHDFLKGEGYGIDYRPYDWGLNDQGPHGRDYGGIRELFDKIRNR